MTLKISNWARNRIVITATAALLIHRTVCYMYIQVYGNPSDSLDYDSYTFECVFRVSVNAGARCVHVLRLLCVNRVKQTTVFSTHNIIIGPSLTVCFSLYQSVGGSKHCFLCFQTDVQLNENQLTASRWINCLLY